MNLNTMFITVFNTAVCVIFLTKSDQIPGQLFHISGQIIALNQKLSAEVDTKYPKFMSLSEMMTPSPSLSNGSSSQPENYFCVNVTEYTVNNSRFCCLKELGHAVRLFTKLIYFLIISVKIQLFFNATQSETNQTTRYVAITYIMGGAGWEFSGT